MRVLWHSGGQGSWCHTIVDAITHGYEHHIGLDVPDDDAIVVVKADHVDDIYNLNDDLSTFGKVVLIVTANEEGAFDTKQIKHPNIKIWLQTPHRHQWADRFLPWGWTPKLEPVKRDRIFEWSFAGQITHVRREECATMLRGMKNGFIEETHGFSDGLSRTDYAELLSSTRVVPCPSGPLTVDTFRVCEALEHGAIPVVDGASPTGPYLNYWTKVFGKNFLPPVIYNWKEFPETLEFILKRWEDHSEMCRLWWSGVKSEWRKWLEEDLNHA